MKIVGIDHNVPISCMGCRGLVDRAAGSARNWFCILWYWALSSRRVRSLQGKFEHSSGGGCFYDLSPTDVDRAQTHQHFAGGFVLCRECGIVLNSDVDIPEVPLQWVPVINRVCSRCMEHQIDGANRLVHGVHDRQPRLGNSETWIRGTGAEL